MADANEQLEVDQGLINREYSEQGLSEIMQIGVDRYVRAMRLFDESASTQIWRTREIDRNTDTANKLVVEVTMLGYVLDKLVPLSADLHWYDAIQAEAEAILSLQSA